MSFHNKSVEKTDYDYDNDNDNEHLVMAWQEQGHRMC